MTTNTPTYESRLALRSLRRHAAGKKTGRAGVRAMEALGYVTEDGTITPAGNQALHDGDQ